MLRNLVRKGYIDPETVRKRFQLSEMSLKDQSLLIQSKYITIMEIDAINWKLEHKSSIFSDFGTLNYKSLFKVVKIDRIS